MRPRRSVDTLLEQAYMHASAWRGRALTLDEWRELTESWRIARALQETRGNRAAAARALRIGRRTLYSKLRRLGRRDRERPHGR